MSGILIAVLLFVSSFSLTLLCRFLALKFSWFDIPNARSSHLLPTPKSGGIGFVVTFSLAVVFLGISGRLETVRMLALLCPLAVAMTGLLDDFRNLPVRIRAAVQLLASAGVMILMGGLPELQVFSISVDFGWLGYGIGVMGLVWLINLFNFMDGIDGIAVAETLFVCLAACALVILQNGSDNALILLCMTAAVSGFGLLNYPPAKIFMGDVGSQYLGLSLGTLGLLTIHNGYMHIWSWAILLGVFIVDSTLTLYKRFGSGKVWYHAHRSHAYQHAALQHQSHAKVDLGITMINLCWLFPLAWISLQYSSQGMLLTVIAYLPLIFLGKFYRAGSEKS